MSAFEDEVARLAVLPPSCSVLGPEDRQANYVAAYLQLRPADGWAVRSRIASRLRHSRAGVTWQRVRESRALKALRRAMHAVRQLATDKRIPRWVRILLAIGCIQIPVLPFDEIALVGALAIIAIWYRQPLRDALDVARGRA